MTAQRELEIKLTLPPETVGQVKKIPLIKAVKKSPKRSTELSVYFDTDKHKLRRQGLMLRVRRIGNRYLQTIKADSHAGPFERGEWEGEIADGEPDLSRCARRRFSRSCAVSCAGSLNRCSRRACAAPYIRSSAAGTAPSWQSTKARSTAAAVRCRCASLSLNSSLATKRNYSALPVNSCANCRAQLTLKSKSQRGYELIDGALGAPVRAITAERPAVRANAREGFRAISGACLRQIIENELAVIKGDSEGAHQMRVGLRRLRVAMSLFSGVLEGFADGHNQGRIKMAHG